MSRKRIYQLTEQGSYDKDYSLVVDHSDLAAGEAKRMLMSTLLAAAGGGIIPYLISATIENPTDSEDKCISYTFNDITIQEIQVVVVGTSPSVTIDPYFTSDRSSSGTDILNSPTVITNTTTGQNITSFNDATVPIDNFIIFKTTAQSGTVDEINITIRYTID